MKKHDILMMVEVIRIKKDLRQRRMDGGSGSGNWGHEGRPGEIGGSAEGGGKHNRLNDPDYGTYTSWTKNRKKLSAPHKLSYTEVKYVESTEGAVVLHNGKRYTCKDGTLYDSKTGNYVNPKTFSHDDVRVIIPDSSNTNFKLTKADKAAMAINNDKFNKSFSAKTGQDAYDKYAKKSGKLYKEFDKDTKDAFDSYTGSGYIPINNALRDGDPEQLSDKKNEQIDRITEALDKSEMDEDARLYRGIGIKGTCKMFGITPNFLENHPENLVGRIGTDNGFGSAGTSQDSGFEKKVRLEILAPKGTKAMYIEPFSSCGDGPGYLWDGEKGQSSISEENETLIQRGTTYQILGYEDKGSYHRFKIAIIGQEHGNSEYDKQRKVQSDINKEKENLFKDTGWNAPKAKDKH